MTDDRTTRRRHTRRSPCGTRRGAFTLVELLIVITILATLTMLVVPVLSSANQLARTAVCTASLRSLQTATILYLRENRGVYFPYQESRPTGTLWYWGLERDGSDAVEGERPIDTTKARLASYMSSTRRVQFCPEARTLGADFKPKFALGNYGYAINRKLPGATQEDITQPGETVVWADSVQINTWQPPASAENPMMEDWYYLDNRNATPATFHFRHRRTCNAVFADSRVVQLEPFWLDPRCDGRVGRPEPPVPPSQVSPLLKLDK
jgi:prepilin-type N-terminal cleavage/methylation domain-containing protein